MHHAIIKSFYVDPPFCVFSPILFALHGRTNEFGKAICEFLDNGLDFRQGCAIRLKLFFVI